MFAALLLATLPQSPAGLEDWFGRELDALTQFYAELHADPELSFAEERSAQRMSTLLRSAGFTVTEKVGGHGVVGVLENGAGPTLLLRCDMDALPILEETGVEYASRNEGVMHACGHDVHMSAWSGAARFLASHRENWSGTLVCIAQPAEERGSGARAMLEDGLLTRFPKPDFCLALHVKAELPVGTIGSCSGYALANVDSVDIIVRGKGGHGSTPHVTHDPVVLASRIVLGLQTIVSREVAPDAPAVITVGSIHGGSKHNIIPNEVKLEITVRSYAPEVRAHLLAAIERTAVHEARAAGFPEDLLPEVTILSESIDATYNDPALVARMDAAIARALGDGSVMPVAPVTGGEDFGMYGPAAGCPAYLFWLGVTPRARWQAAQDGGAPVPAVHTSRFKPEPRASLRAGVTALSAAALEVLAKPSR
ncbi:MAG: amidohydrolase [Planctomycetota bacterium]|nr:amidohydrolase [Planctomycetota bacterium]